MREALQHHRTLLFYCIRILSWIMGGAVLCHWYQGVILLVLVSEEEVLTNGRKRTSSSLRTVDSGMNTFIPSDLDVSCMLSNTRLLLR